ncbi:MAG: M20 family metallopeptidase [Treponema sp.]|nr:M20 family metallopeptidase [Treponema sp.]
MTNTDILAASRALVPWLVETRRHIHGWPELGKLETETAAYIESRLAVLGVPFRRIGTGVVGRLEGRRGGPTVALRADIDALPVEETNDLDYRSRRPGIMHACGHDAHTAIVLGVASLFSKRPDALAGNLVLLFQPDEEGDGGALPLIEAGALEGVDHVLGLHVMPYLDVGEVEVKKGALNGASTSLRIVIGGRGAHGAYPELGVDAVLIASHVVQALHHLVSRYISPLDEAVITIGTISGGLRSNIIADEVVMTATMRTTSETVRDLLVDRARAVVEGIPASLGGKGSLEASYGYAALVSDDRDVDIVAKVAGELLGKDSVLWKEKPSLGVEDFSFYLKKTRGAFWHLGCGRGPKGERAGLHSGGFTLDEECLPIGVAVQAAAILELMKEGIAT